MKKKLGILFLIILIAGLVVSYKAYQWIYNSNTEIVDTYDFYIPTGSNYEDVITQLQTINKVKNIVSFNSVATLMKYPASVKPGRYVITSGMSNKAMISKLRSGDQDPVRITISTGRFLSDIVGVVAPKIEADSILLIEELTRRSALASKGLIQETAITQILPNTYEFFWTTNALDFSNRMKKESDRFWNANSRSLKLEKLHMTREEVMTLASIVEKESNRKSERPTMAGVYLNRIRQGIPLAADPTIVFGLKEFTLRRVLNRHINTPHPYNTHLNKGLPPGPICMPSISSIDAVLNAEEHDYIFFCAKPGYNNGHAFAKTNAQHERNARVYHRWLDAEGIRG